MKNIFDENDYDNYGGGGYDDRATTGGGLFAVLMFAFGGLFARIQSHGRWAYFDGYRWLGGCCISVGSVAGRRRSDAV